MSSRREWTDEQFAALADHPDRRVRALLAKAPFVTPEQRARLVEDPESLVLFALADGPDFLWWTTAPEPLLPMWAYERLIERRPNLADVVAGSPFPPEALRERLRPAGPPAAPAAPEEPLETLAGDESEHRRATAARDPRLPADLVARLAVDPSDVVRLAVSMRPELTEDQRAAIDYHVGRNDRIPPVSWVTGSRDPEVLRRCVHSAHIGLRRSAACNRHLPPDLVAVLATDDDFAVRLLLCENHAEVPGETVLNAYLEARTMTRGRLLGHPRFPLVGLARLADSPDPGARGLVRLDPEAPPELIERLSHDPHPAVRAWMADDPRLPPERVLELFEDPLATERAAANPHLPVALMDEILAGADALADEVVEGQPAIYLGNWDRVTEK